MKRIMKFAGIIAASAALMVCCSKEASYDDVSTDPTTQNPADGQEDTNPSVVSGEVLDSFGVKFENDVNTNENDVNTKVSILIGTENATLSFNENDQVLVVSGETSAAYQYDGTKFVPVVDPVTLDTDATVYYPASAFALSGSDVVFTMPAAVTSLEDLGAKNPLAAQLSGNGTDGYTATFKAVASILQVGVTADVNINSVMLNFGNSNKYAENAKFSIGWSEGAPTMEVSEQAGSSAVTVDVTPAKTAEAFFILPTLALTEGLEVTANLAGNHNGGTNSYPIKNESTSAPVRNTISKMSFYAGLFSGGAGTAEDPYKIASVRDFRNLIKYSTQGFSAVSKNASDFLGAYYQQTANINFKNVKMSPIGDGDHQFTGHYDGNHKELQNVNISETGQFAGIFAYVNGSASIKDLTVSGSITKTGTTSNSCVGGIAGIVRGAASISGCTNNATITSSATYTGGIVGRLYQSTSSTAISGCTNQGAVTSSESFTGGIVGQQINGGTVSECVNTGIISGTSYVGGIAGDIGAAGAAPSALSFIEFCRNNATINASSNVSGGIAGRVINGSVVSKCFAKGTVSSESYDVGGIAGTVQVNNSNEKARVCIYDCLTAVNVTTTRSGDSSVEARTGGAIGIVTNNQAQYIAIDNCGVIATSVTVGGGTKVGGFVGRFSSSNTNKNRTRIRNCYTLVSSISAPNSLYGGFVGNADSYGELHYCYYVADDSNVTISNNTTKDNLTKKTTEEIASTATCEAFNANSYYLTINKVDYGSKSPAWAIPAGCEYPVPGSLIEKGVEYYK